MIFQFPRSSRLISIATSAEPTPGYYGTVEATDSTTLRTTLHAASDDHTRFPESSGRTDTWEILKIAEENPNNSDNILDVCKKSGYENFSGGNGPHNREHMWPKSYGYQDNTSLACMEHVKIRVAD